MAKYTLDQARGLKRSNATWQCTARRAPTWITPKEQPPYRPYIVLVLEVEKDLVRTFSIHDERPALGVVLQTLLQAMLRPAIGSGGRHRPARILLDDAELVQALTSQLTAMDVRCEYRADLPLMTAALREMEAHINRREPTPGLLSQPGMTVPLVGELYAAAAEYYRQAPWRWLSDSQPIEVRYPSDGRARYALVLGHGGDAFGLSSYESLDDLRKIYTGTKPEQVSKQISAFALVFDEGMAMSFDDLDAMERYGWPVAGKLAYPWAIKMVPPNRPSALSVSEALWLAAALRVVPDFLTGHLHADSGLPQPAEATYSLPEVHGGQKIALRFPVYQPEAEEPSQEERSAVALQVVERFIQDWYWDEPSHKYARQVGAFLLAFITHLAEAGLSEQTVHKHFRNCLSIGRLACRYGRRKEFSPAIFLGEPSFVKEFKRHVSSSESAIASYEVTWRRLQRYVRTLMDEE